MKISCQSSKTAKDKAKGKSKEKGKGIEPEVQAINDASSKPTSGAKWGTKCNTGDFEGVDSASAGANESVSML